MTPCVRRSGEEKKVVLYQHRGGLNPLRGPLAAPHGAGFIVRAATGCDKQRFPREDCIAPRYDAGSVRGLFDDMAATYGRVNLISSFGFTARWRHQAVDGLPLANARSVVDLMSGMGELWRSLARGLPADAVVVGVDFSEEMVRRTRNRWPFAVELRTTDVFEWRYEPSSADIVVCSFGLKTLSRAQQGMLAALVARLLKPGGRFSFIEISVPGFAPWRALYLAYLNYVIPVIGRLFMGNAATYAMLGVYTQAFGDARYFADCLRDEGLETAYVSRFFGCATGVRGARPAPELPRVPRP